MCGSGLPSIVQGAQSSRSNVGLTILHLNVQSLRSKQSMLPVVLQACSADVICLSEHWLHPLENISIDGYKPVTSFCRKKMRGRGGVIIYLKSDMECVQRQDINGLAVELQAEVAAVDLCNSKLTVVCVYRVPGEDVVTLFHVLDDIARMISSQNRLGVICGDFNINLLTTNNESSQFLDTMGSNGFIQCIHEATRVTPTSSTLIDNIFVNFHKQQVVSKCFSLGFSDHLAQSICLTNPNFLPKGFSDSNNNPVQSRSYSQANMDAFVYFLSEINWEQQFQTVDVSQQWGVFLSKISTLHETLFPLRVKKSCQKKQRAPDELLYKFNQLHDLKVLSNNNGSFSAVYRTFLKEVRFSCIQWKRRTIEQRLLGSRNLSKTCWDIINDFRGNQSTRESFQNMHIGDAVCSDKKVIADEFNKYFISSIDALVSDITSSTAPTINFIDFVNPNSMVLFPTSTKEVESVVRSLRSSSSAGVDGIPSRVMKESIQVTLEPIVELINASFVTGVFPSEFKKSKVVPIFKKGDPHQLGNFRPVGILPCYSKIFEKLLETRVRAFLDKSNILNPYQFGFRKGKSTGDACLSLFEEVLQAIDKGDMISALMCDVARGFDTVNHEILLFIMQRYGVRGVVLELFRSYLSGRVQQVDIGSKSGWLPLKTGVVQGSVLGPLLFLIYINALAPFLLTAPEKPSVSHFADDTRVSVRGKNATELSSKWQNVSEMMHAWFTGHMLYLNPEKTIHIVFSRRKLESSRVEARLNNKIIAQHDKVQFLGFLLDSGMTWRPHLNKLCGKLSSGVFLLKTLHFYVDRDVLRLAYFGIIESHLRYGILCWGNSSDSMRAFRLQKKAIRAISGVWDQRVSCRPLFTVLNILPLPAMYIMELLVHTRKQLKNLTVVREVHGYNTRNRDNLVLDRCRLTATMRGPSYQGRMLYNSLPRCYKYDNITEGQFKSQVRKFLMSGCPYSVDEFRAMSLHHG